LARLTKTGTPVIREPLNEDQTVRELRKSRDTLDRLIDALFVQPVVEWDADQVGTQAVFTLDVFDPLQIVDVIEYNIMDDPTGFKGWASNWTSSTGVVGDDVTLHREIRATLQGKHNTTIKVRVRYTDTVGGKHFWNGSHTYDPDDIAEITVDSVGVIGSDVTITFHGDEDTRSIWRKIRGDPDSSATQMFPGRVGSFTFDASEGEPRQWEAAGKNRDGAFGPFIFLDLDVLFVLDKSIIIGHADLSVAFEATGWTLTGGVATAFSGGPTSISFVAGVQLPLGVEIVEFISSASAPSGGLANVSLLRGTSTLAHISGGGSQSLNHTVQPGTKYWVQVDLKASGSGDATFDQATIVYDSPNLNAVL
jgi:hypothetical protein